MSANKKLLLLPGDGIGPEIVDEVRKIIDWMDKKHSVTFDISEGLIGGAAIDETGGPLPEETLAAARASDAVLMGAAGGPGDGVGRFDPLRNTHVVGSRVDLPVHRRRRHGRGAVQCRYGFGAA